jgi:beta-galactosidase
MRSCQSLQTDWYVSISPADAVLAATGRAGMLEMAGDPENHPQKIDLPGDPAWGKRPLSDVPAGTPGAATNARGERLPNSFLSYARTVDIPADYAGKTVFLHLDNVRYHVTVSVNGTQVAQYVGGWEPHRIDITEAVVPGETALLLITVGNSGVSGHREFDPYIYTGTRLPTCKEIENNLVHPVAYGGADRAVEHVTLEAVPRVHTEYVFANPKVAQGVLKYKVVLTNDTAADAAVHCASEAVGAKTLVDEDVTIPARGTVTIDKVIPWADAIFWDVDHPHLYDLRTTLTVDGKVADTYADYFGFREFTINGHSFYLNGKKIHLHGNSGHVGPEQDALSLEDKMTLLRELKERLHLVQIRLHARPQDPRWVEAADRVGMLITTETALWTTGFHSFDWVGSEEACFANVCNHFMEAMVRRDRNRPSVVIWSLTNEMSPITPFDLAWDKMAALTRVLKRIIDVAEAEDDSRIVQMSSAMDFIGNLKMYNLHYPKNWQAFPDYPHTAYWLDSSFLFPWYGPKRMQMPSWSWRKDKPLFFGEFTCVFGATPDNQASIVGDIAFEQADGGSDLVDAKLWPLEVKSYRRLDVSGFCAWAFALGHYTSVDQMLKTKGVPAHTEAVRPIAVLDHTYRTRYFSGDEVALELSIHNDTRHAMPLALCCQVWNGDEVIWTETMPAAVYGPAENRAFTNRFRAPLTDARLDLRYTAVLTSGEKVVDQWTRVYEIHPKAAPALPAGCAFYDPEGILAARLAERGVAGAVCLESLDALTNLSAYHTLWINFDEAKVHAGDWKRIRHAVQEFVKRGGVAVLDKPTVAIDDLPTALQNGRGFAQPGDRLEITYAYVHAPDHPALQGFTDADFSLWGEDYYLAHRCFETPQEGNVLPLLAAGTDRAGLTSSPLLELRYGQGSFLVSTLECFGKLTEAPVVSNLIAAMASYRPCHVTSAAGLCVGEETLARFREVGYLGENGTLANALAADVAVIDGPCLDRDALPALGAALKAGKTVCLHALDPLQTQAVLDALNLPGQAVSGKIEGREYDTIRRTHRLASGMTSNYLFWIVDKAKIPPWTPAPLHPEPATALIRLPEGAGAAQITRRGAVTIYAVGSGTLVIDNLRWHLADFDEPERPRRYVMTLLTNLGVPLTRGVDKRMSEEYETAEERRERGHF